MMASTLLTCTLRGDQKACDSIHKPEYEVSRSEPPYINHGAAQSGFDYSVTHADNEQQEEGEGIAGCIQYADYNEEDFGSHIRAFAVLIFYHLSVFD